MKLGEFVWQIVIRRHDLLQTGDGRHLLSINSALAFFFALFFVSRQQSFLCCRRRSHRIACARALHGGVVALDCSGNS